MNENLKKLTEFLSAQDAETRKKASKMEETELIAFASEHGITVTAEDFAEAKKQAEENKKASEDGELSDDELDAVAGGGSCGCFIVGGGTEDLAHVDDEAWGDGGCACVAYGQGDDLQYGEHVGARCLCGGYGEGGTYWN